MSFFGTKQEKGGGEAGVWVKLSREKNVLFVGF